MPLGEDAMKMQLAVDKLQRVEWIESLCPWQVMATFTFRWEASLDSTRRCFEKFMARKIPQVSYFYSVEANPSRDGHHAHSLWGDCRGVFRKEVWADWFKRYGRARIELVRSKGQSAEYASKYLCKAQCWWNVKLQWHRLPSLSGRAFELEGDRGHLLPAAGLLGAIAS